MAGAWLERWRTDNGVCSPPRPSTRPFLIMWGCQRQRQARSSQQGICFCYVYSRSFSRAIRPMLAGRRSVIVEQDCQRASCTVKIGRVVRGEGGMADRIDYCRQLAQNRITCRLKFITVVAGVLVPCGPCICPSRPMAQRVPCGFTQVTLACLHWLV